VGKVKRSPDESLRVVGSWLVRLVDDDDIPDLEQPGLYRLNPVAEPRSLDYHNCVCERRDIGAILTRADGLDQYQRVAHGIEKMDESRGRPGEAALAAATGHAPHKDSVIRMAIHHSNTIAQNRAAS